MPTAINTPGKSVARAQQLVAILDRMARDGRRSGTIRIEIDYDKGVSRRVRYNLGATENEQDLPETTGNRLDATAAVC